ncbi:response regulator transcription factor [Nocardiopsis sp. RV163]|uniref:response regulator transcription factor n=1 Tax=Nocardiopsis sp. RV163 TaxID=1661388 RepID=UPI00064C3BC5
MGGEPHPPPERSTTGDRRDRTPALRLVLSRATVKTHVSRLLTKLDVRDRAQLVVFAYETGLVRAARRD